MEQSQDDRESIVAQYSATVWRIALSRTRREDAAEEVYQEVFLRFFRKERVFRDAEHRKAYIIRTTLNYCKRYRTAAFRNPTLSLEEVSETLTFSDEKRGVLEVILRLPAKYRIPIQLYYMEGMEAEECAKVLNLSAGAFRTRLSRAKAMLREELKGEGINV